MSRRIRTNQAGFTLVELLVVTVVLGIVASIALVSFISALDKAKQRGTMADMRSLARALEAYMVDHGFPPGDAGGVTALVPVLIPYETSVVPVRDHWTHPYDYASDAAIGKYTVESFGKDGIDGANISYATRADFNLDIVLTDGIFLAAPE